MLLSERQKQIINTAVHLIASKGIQNLTIKNLSREIGISEPAIYRHFENKHEILMTLLNSFEEMSAFALIETEKQELKAIQKIEKFILDRYRVFTENPEFAKVLFAEEIFQNDRELAQKVMSVMHQHKEIMEEIIISGQQNGEIRDDIQPKEMFRIVFGSMRLLVNQWCLTNFVFNLQEEGELLWQAARKMITI